ncbi:MAG: diaminopimelate epimerase [Thermoguttaceae bacterium]|jgi:diaminopimelate epimerase
MQFTKMHGAGNDYVYIDLAREKLPIPPEELAPMVSNRHFGVGSDGLVLICPSDVADAQMRMFNADGSESEMCGNAIRCVAKYVAERSSTRPSQLKIASGSGVHTLNCEYKGDSVTRVRVDMGAPILVPEQIPTTLRSPSGATDPVRDLPVSSLGLDFSSELGADSPECAAFMKAPMTCVSMGNPHVVIFVDEITDALTLKCGPKIERSVKNFPNRTNVHFVELISPTEVRMRVWERGTGETLACGTGACAVGVACALTGRTQQKVLVHLLGGDLEIEWVRDDNSVFMTGPALKTFTGELTPEFFRQSQDKFSLS